MRLDRLVLAATAVGWLGIVGCQKPLEKGTVQPVAAVEKPAAAEEAPAKESADSPFWPRFHGPNNDNISPATGLLKQWPEGGPKLLWSSKGMGEGYASVSLADGRIYTAGNRDGKTVATAMDLDGKILWQVPAGKAWEKEYPGTRSTPTIDGDRLYYESPIGDVVCLQAADGKEVWRVNILEEFEAKNITWALAESLLVDGDRVICCPGGAKASVAALDKATGKTVWAAKSTGDVAGYATPVLAEMQGLRMILTMNQKALIGVNADDGELLFRHPHETKYDINATSPVYRDGHVFITSGYGSGSEMLRLTVEGKKVSTEVVWQSKDLDNQHGGLVVLDGHIYGASHNAKGGRWICLAWKDGEQKYAERGVGRGTLTYADGMLYTLSENGKAGLVPATPEKHELVSSFKVPEGGSGPTWAHPVVIAGRLYIRHGDFLHALDVKK